MNLPLDSNWYEVFHTVDASGVLADADSTPSAQVFEDASAGAAMGTTVTDIGTGVYRVLVPITAANGYEVGKVYNVEVSATVGGIVSKKKLVTFRVVAAETTVGLPNVRVAESASAALTAIAAAILGATQEGSHTLGDIIRLITGVVAGKASNFLTGTIVFNSLNGAKTRLTVTTDETGRLSITVGDLT